MEKVKLFLIDAYAWCRNNQKWLIPVAVGVAVLLAFGIGYIKGCVR